MNGHSLEILLGSNKVLAVFQVEQSENSKVARASDVREMNAAFSPKLSEEGSMPACA